MVTCVDAIVSMGCFILGAVEKKTAIKQSFFYHRSGDVRSKYVSPDGKAFIIQIWRSSASNAAMFFLISARVFSPEARLADNDNEDNS